MEYLIGIGVILGLLFIYGYVQASKWEKEFRIGKSKFVLDSVVLRSKCKKHFTSYVTINGKECEEDMLSAVMIKHKDNIVRVGSGFTIEQRQDFYKNPDGILGKIITVQYFEETKNQEGGISLRFPTFKVLHGDARLV